MVNGKKWLLTLLHLLLLAHVCTVVVGLVEDSNDPLVIAIVADTTPTKYEQQDHYILDGVNFFAQWCNNSGGFKYGNYSRYVNVITKDGSGLTTPLENAAVTAAYASMMNYSTLALSPISTPRTQVAVNVTETNKQINIVVGASADSLFNSGFKYMVSTVVPTSQIPQYSLSQFIGKVSNYVLFSTNDAVSVSVTTSVQTYMNKSGIPMAYPPHQLVIDSTNNGGLEGQVVTFFQTYLANISADLFVCTFPPDDFSIVASAFEQIKPNVSAAAFVLPLTRTVQQTDQQGTTGDYWVGATQFDPSTDYGVDGEFGGTSLEFYNEFETLIGHPPDPYAATAAAALMSYYVAVQLAGTVNSDAVKQSLVDMPTFNSFLGDINYYNNGSSVYAKYLTFQFSGGVGQFINASNSLVYPAPWPWVYQPTPPPVIQPTSPPEEPIKQHSKALSIALGVITGLCILVALAALGLLIVKRELFRKQGIVYCVLIVVGVLSTFAAALTTLPTPTNALCLAFPWLLGVGFTLVFGCLFIKTWVLLMIFRSAEKMQKMKSLTLTVGYITRLIVSAVLIEVIFMIVWTTVDPPKAELKSTFNHDRQLMCTRTNPAFWAIFIGYKGLWLVAGIVVSVMTRNIREDYNESKNIVLSIYNCFVVTVVAVVLAFILNNVPAAITLIQVIAILVCFTFALVVLFSTPFTHFVQGDQLEMRMSGIGSTTSAGSMRTTSAQSGGSGKAHSANSGSAGESASV